MNEESTEQKWSRWIVIACIVMILMGGASISTYLIVRANHANSVCLGVQSVHNVLDDILSTSKQTSLNSLHDNPDSNFTEQDLNKYYNSLFKQLEPIDVSC